MRFQGGHATNLGGSGARGIHRVERVDIKAHIGRPIAHHPARLGHDCLDAQGVEFINVNHADALLLAPGVLGIVVQRTPNADLYRALGVKQALFDSPPEGGSVGVLEAAKIAVPGVGVGIKVHHAYRPFFSQGPHDGQG